MSNMNNKNHVVDYLPFFEENSLSEAEISLIYMIALICKNIQEKEDTSNLEFKMNKTENIDELFLMHIISKTEAEAFFIHLNKNLADYLAKQELKSYIIIIWKIWRSSLITKLGYILTRKINPYEWC